MSRKKTQSYVTGTLDHHGDITIKGKDHTNVHTVHNGKASACVKCGKCEAVCPQHLPIREPLEKTAAEFEK